MYFLKLPLAKYFIKYFFLCFVRIYDLYITLPFALLGEQYSYHEMLKKVVDYSKFAINQ